MLILAIDTSTSAIGVAVHRAGEPPVRAVRTDARAHTEHLAPLVEEALRGAGAGPADLDAIATGTGPGPFTGLRVGMVTAVTMGHALGIPVLGVCSLDALAEQALAAAPDAPEVLVATDARRREVYWARYTRDTDGARPVTGAAVGAAEAIPADARALPTAGRGPVLYPDAFGNPLPDVLDVDPGVLATIAERRAVAGVDQPVEPLYLRRPDALTSAERAAR